jgi:hypothetical protein
VVRIHILLKVFKAYLAGPLYHPYRLEQDEPARKDYHFNLRNFSWSSYSSNLWLMAKDSLQIWLCPSFFERGTRYSTEFIAMSDNSGLKSQFLSSQFYDDSLLVRIILYQILSLQDLCDKSSSLYASIGFSLLWTKPLLYIYLIFKFKRPNECFKLF